MNTTIRTQSWLLASSIALASVAEAKDKPGRDKNQERVPAPAKPGTVAEPATSAKEPWVKVDVVITTQERQVVQEYVQGKTKGKAFWNKSKHLPPGLSKKLARGGELPPGWQKKFVRGTILPAEVFEQCHPLPPEIVVHLPPPPPDTILVAVSGKVVRLIKATREILDVFEVSY